MDSCDASSSRPFFVLVFREGQFLVLQASWFEGRIYPCHLGAAVDYEDAITDALGWCGIGKIDLPIQIELRAVNLNEVVAT